MKNTNTAPSEQFPNPIDTSNKHVHDRSLLCLDTGTSIECGGVKLVLWAQVIFTDVLL
jgi:hypothetical protein